MSLSRLNHAVLGSLVQLCVLTERPHGGTLVCLEALYESDAVLLRRGLHGAGIERFVVDVDIFEVLEVLLGILDLENGLLVSLFGGHDGAVCSKVSCQKFGARAKTSAEVRLLLCECRG